MKMNSYIILGILVLIVGTGIGTYLMNLGSGLSSAVSQKQILDKFEETQQKIEEAKGSVNSAKDKKEIEKIENEFNEWASDFIKNRDLKKLELEKNGISAKGDRISLNTKLKPQIESFFVSIKSIIDAYNNKSGATIKYNIAELPSNIFDSSAGKYEAVLIFNSEVNWKITITPAAPLADDPMIDIKVSIYSSNDELYDKFSIAILDDSRFSVEPRIQIVKHENSRFNMNNIARIYTVDEVVFKTLAKDLMESQLLQL